MSVDDHKSETSLGFELLKWFGVSASVLTTVIVLIVLNPEFTWGLVVGSFVATPFGSEVVKDLQKQMDDVERMSQNPERAPNSTLRAALGYGEGLTAFKDLAENAIIEPNDIAARAMFPTTRLGQCSPLSYSTLIGKKTKSKIKRGDFFTTENVEL